MKLVLNTVSCSMLIALAACGGGSSSPTPTPTPSPIPTPTPTPTPSPVGIFHLAGNTTLWEGAVDGNLSQARFSAPAKIVSDAQNNLYVADTGNFTIRKISADGQVSTYVGTNGETGYVDAQGASAKLGIISDMLAAPDGTLYIAENNSYAVRKISPTGVVSTFAGTQLLRGYQDGPGSSALFTEIKGLSLDAEGNVYVSTADMIRKIAPDGTVSTWLGMAGPGTLDGPRSIAKLSAAGPIAATGNSQYFVDGFALRMFDSLGNVQSMAGSVTQAATPSSQEQADLFYKPVALSSYADSDAVLVDGNAVRLAKYTVGIASVFSVMSDLAGNRFAAGHVDGKAGEVRFARPNGIARSSKNEYFIADTGNNAIRKMSADGIVTSYAGPSYFRGSNDGVGVAARFNDIRATAGDAEGNAYILDGSNCTLRKIDAKQNVTTLVGSAGDCRHVDGSGANARLADPLDMTRDAKGNLYVTEKDSVRKISPTGVVSTIFSQANATDGFLVYGLHGIALDGADNMYLSYGAAVNTVDGRHAAGKRGVIKVSPTGTISNLSLGGTGRPNDLGPAPYIYHIAADKNGTVYALSDGALFKLKDNSIAAMLDAQGKPITFTPPAMLNQYSAKSSFFIYSMAFDDAGNLFITDSNKATLRMISPTGEVSTVAGTAGMQGEALGTALPGLLHIPGALSWIGGRQFLLRSGNGIVRVQR